MPDSRGPTEDELFARLTDPASPRTPLHFKHLDRQEGRAGPIVPAAAGCVFHRTEGYAVGLAASSPRPLSKMFGEDDDG
jgi:hypothetical protein